MSVKVVFHDREWDLAAPLTVLEAIEQVGPVKSVVLAIRCSERLACDAVLADGDHLERLEVIAGG